MISLVASLVRLNQSGMMGLFTKTVHHPLILKWKWSQTYSFNLFKMLCIQSSEFQ